MSFTQTSASPYGPCPRIAHRRSDVLLSRRSIVQRSIEQIRSSADEYGHAKRPD